MNSSSNSTQHNALLATGQVCRDRVPVAPVVHAVVRLSRGRCAHGIFVAHSVPPLMRALIYVPRPVVCLRPAPNRVCRPALWVVTEKHPIATPPWKTLSRHKIFYRDRNVPPLGKLCCNTRRPLSLPKLGPAPNPVATLNFYHDTGSTIFVVTGKVSVATQTTQHAWEQCRDTEIPVMTHGLKALSCAHVALHVCHAHPGQVVRLALEPCRKTEDLVATQG